MNIIEPSAKIINPESLMRASKYIESIGRVCYKSEDLATEESAEKFCSGIIKRGHESVIEHVSVSVRFICDRGVSHELVRHRIASFSQESTRYCNYSKEKFNNEITVIKPPGMDANQEAHWQNLCTAAEQAYLYMLRDGASPQIARSVLPNSLKTELVMTANLREWRLFFKLRTSPAAHPQMRQITIPLLKDFAALNSVIFGELLELKIGD